MQVAIRGRDETMTIRTAVDPTTLTTLLDSEIIVAAEPHQPSLAVAEA
jgi:hypothetical protein